MSVNLLPLGSLGAVEQNGTVTFGIWLPWVSAVDGNTVTLKVIHAGDLPICQDYEQHHKFSGRTGVKHFIYVRLFQGAQ